MNTVCTVEYAIAFSIQLFPHCHAEPFQKIRFHLKVANESRFLLNINILQNLSFTHAKYYF